MKSSGDRHSRTLPDYHKRSESIQHIGTQDTVVTAEVQPEAIQDFVEFHSGSLTVTKAWSKTQAMPELEEITDMAKLSAGKATATRFRRVDEQGEATTYRRTEKADIALLRQPGGCSGADERYRNRWAFSEPMTQLTMALLRKSGLMSYASAAEEEIAEVLKNLHLGLHTSVNLSTTAMNTLIARAVACTIVSPERLPVYSWYRLLPTAARHFNFPVPAHVVVGYWDKVMMIGDEVPVTSGCEQSKDVKGLPLMSRKPHPRCEACMRTEWRRPMVVCNWLRGCGRLVHAFRCAITVYEEERDTRSWRCIICLHHPRAGGKESRSQSDADSLEALGGQPRAVGVVSHTALYSSPFCKVCNTRDGDFVTCQQPYGCGMAVHRQSCSVFTRLSGHARWMCWICFDLMVNWQASSVSQDNIAEAEASARSMMKSQIDVHPLNLSGRANEESERFRGDVQRFMNERLNVTTTSQGISGDRDWLQAMQEHGQAVVDQAAAHHNEQGERTLHKSHPGSEGSNTKRHAALEEGNPQGKQAQKKAKAEGPVEQPIEKPWEATDAAAGDPDMVRNFGGSYPNAAQAGARARSRTRVPAGQVTIADDLTTDQATATMFRKMDEQRRFIEPLDGEVYRKMMGRRLDGETWRRDQQASLRGDIRTNQEWRYGNSVAMTVAFRGSHSTIPVPVNLAPPECSVSGKGDDHQSRWTAGASHRTLDHTDEEIENLCKAVNTPRHVEDDSIMRKWLPKLKEARCKRRGNRLTPEPPRLVAKVCEEEGRGELWMGPLPTVQRLHMILETKPNIQVFCCANFPDRVREEPHGEWGMFIPGTKAFRCEMSNPQTRSGDLRVLRSCVINSLRQGDNAYVHCVSGISEAPMTAALLSAMLMSINLDEAMSIIEQTGNPVRSSFVKWIPGPWANAVLSEDVAEAVVPTGYSYKTSRPDAGLVHATTDGEGGTRPICSGRKSASFKEGFEHDSIAVASIEEAANLSGSRFCMDCEILLKVSLRIQVDRFFN